MPLQAPGCIPGTMLKNGLSIVEVHCGTAQDRSENGGSALRHCTMSKTGLSKVDMHCGTARHSRPKLSPLARFIQHMSQSILVGSHHALTR